MRILILRDKKPGHFHQAEGLAAAAERIGTVEIDRLEVRSRRLAHDSLRRRLLHPLLARPAFGLRLLYGIDGARIVRPDLVVGSGRPTIAAGLLLSKLHGAPFAYSGWPDHYDPADFGLILVDTPRKSGLPNAAFAPVPSLIDPDALREPRRLRSAQDLRGAEVALMIGGDAHSHHYAHRDWVKLVDFVVETERRYGLRWRVATSRRSPEELYQPFTELLAAGRIAEFVDFRVAGPGSADRLYGADAVVVTEDSISMISEAITARRPAVALAPADVRKTSDFEWLAVEAAAGHLAVMPLSFATAERFASTLTGLAPPETDARDTIAAALRRVLPAPLAGGDARLPAFVRAAE